MLEWVSLFLLVIGTNVFLAGLAQVDWTLGIAPRRADYCLYVGLIVFTLGIIGLIAALVRLLTG